MEVDRFNRSRIGESEGYLDLAQALGNHVCGQPLSESRQFHEEPAVIGMHLKRFDLDAVNTIRGVGFGDDLSQSFFGAGETGQLQAVFVAERYGYIHIAFRAEGYGPFIQSFRCCLLHRHLFAF